MAVEIPVVIDIDGAFQEAADRVNTAIKPLKAEIEGNVLDLKFKSDISEDRKKQLDKLSDVSSRA